MNKKFSTLVAGLLLAVTGGVTAQNNHAANGEIPYRTDKVMSAVTSEHCNDVFEIDGNKWYQLVVNEGKAEDRSPLGSETTVLTMERDYDTGHLYLVVKKVEDAALTHSLWKLVYNDDAVSGHYYTFINKETGYALTFDHTRATVLTTRDAAAAVQNVNATILDGCNDAWEWYTNDKQTVDNPFAPELVYSTYHNSTKVLALAVNAQNHVVLVSADQRIAGNGASHLQNIISLKPVMAGAKVLSADEINSMIDADASYKTFAVGNPNRGNNFSDLAGKLAKFKFNVTMANNPLASPAGFVAVESAVTELNRDNYGANPATDYVIAAGQKSVYAGYNVLFKEPTADNYLNVTEKYLENPSTGAYNGLKLEMAPYTNPAEITADAARFHFKVTYYPTNDSLVIEPLNASMPNKEGNLADLQPNQYLNTINAGVAYGTPGATYENSLINKAAGVPVALAAINFGGGMDAQYSLTVNVPYKAIGLNLPTTGMNANDIKYAAICKEDWACAAHSGNHAVNPAYVTFYCTNHDGPDHQNEGVEYQADMQMKLSFDHSYTTLVRTSVPSGVYFIRLSTGLPNANDVTSTQKRADGSYIVADMGGHLVYDVQETTQDFTRMPATQWVIEQLNCPVVEPVAGDPNYNKAPVVKIRNREYSMVAFQGQLYDAGNGKCYIINHVPYANGMGTTGTGLHDNNRGNNYFSCADTIYFERVEANTAGYSVISKDVLAENVYALHHGNENLPNLFLGVNAADNYIKDLAGDPTYFELHLIQSAAAYGVTSTLAGAPQLTRDVYAIKVKDANKIDNDHKYIALDHMHRYIVADEADIQAGKNGLTWAIFYLKENNKIGDVPYYALVNATGEYSKKVGENKTIVLNNTKTKGKLAVENISNNVYIDDLCNTTSDVFALTVDPRPLYKSLANDAAYSSYVNNLNKSVTLSTLSGNEFLYEDMQSGILNYLAVENKSTQTKFEGLYVDYVAKSSARMPQYLFAVAADSVGAYYYCGENAHGATHGLNPSCDHKVKYPGYVIGRFLVNLNDSIQNSINKVESPSRFQHDNYTRLAFVEAVHRGDQLYVLKAPYTLYGENAITGTDADGNVLVIPTFLEANKKGTVYDIVELDGKHNNAVFSLRYVGDTEEEGFLLESNGQFSAIGSFEGAWLRIVNGVPVLAKFYNVNGNHNTGDIIDGNGSTGVNDFGQVLNQAAILTLGTVDKIATSIDPVEVSNVSVIGGEGSVTILNASNKVVTITNVLGQTVTKTTVSSDNATISVPAGIVVVAVEGQKATKTVVK